jgi:glycosyltransferase involved in cell wall biosynthesis
MSRTLTPVPLVSALLAVHNGASYLTSAVRSVLRQTLGDLELIVIDDASTDDTRTILSGVSDSRLAVLTNDEVLGLAASLNVGLDRASGRYVARLDADDIALPERLELQVARLQANPKLGAVGSAVLDLDEAGRPGTLHRNPSGADGVRWLALFSSPFFHPSVLVDRERLDEHGLRYDTAFLESEDYDLWTRLLEFSDGANLTEALVLKRVHAGQASQRRGELQQSFQRQIALREIARIAPELGDAQAELAWSFGTAPTRDSSAADAFLSLLSTFERRYGVDSEVRASAMRTLARGAGWKRAGALGGLHTARGTLDGTLRLAAEPGARRRASAWLAEAGLELSSARTRVVVVSPEPTPYRAPLFDRIAERPDIDLTVIYAAHTVAGRTWSVDFRHRSVFLAGVPLPWLKRLLRHDYPFTPGVRRALEAARPEVVVVSGWSTFASQAALLWSRTHRVPVALLVESHDLGPRPAWRRRVKGGVVPALVRRAESFLAVGSLARESLVAHGAPPDRVRVFANTVDVDAWEMRARRLSKRRDDLRAALGIGVDDVLVLFAGRLAVETGPDSLLRAAAAAADERLVLAFAGSGSEDKALERLALDLGVRLHLLGDLAEEALAEAYVAADVFALLSLHETWGVVVNEAAASGLPLVLSDRVGAAHDLLAHGENGFIVAAEDVDATAAALERLAVDPALRKAMGERSRELVRGWGYEPSVASFVATVREATAR